MSRVESEGGEVAAQAPRSADVARLAGVSRTQVSYVLNGTGINHVSEEKRERILAAARELGYRPHPSASSLRRGYSKEFSIFFPAPYTPRINDMLGAVHETGLAMDCVVTQYSWNRYHDPARKDEAFRAMLARRPRGIFCSLLDLDKSYVELARGRGIDRILVLDVERHTDIETLYMPVEPVGYLAARHLLERGCRRLAALKPADPVQSRPFRFRLKGMKRALQEFPGAALRIVDWPAHSLRPSLAAAREFVATLMSAPERPDSLYAYSDDYAFPVLRCLRETGVPVPGSLAVLGTDDHPSAELWNPSLSSIRFDEVALGERAVAMINGLITGTTIDARFSHPPEPVVIERESTGSLSDL